MKLIRFVSKATPLLLAFLLQLSVFSQAPKGFSYQAVIQDGSGAPIASQPIGLRITLENALHLAYYTETQTTTSNAQGVISVTIGSGLQVGVKTFDSIPWMNGDVYIKLEIDPAGGTSYTAMGVSTPLKSVPYALYAENTKEIVSNPNAAVDDPIFEVKNKLGQVVFGVYEGGVRVYVEDNLIKGAKGGFAVGGLTNQSKAGQAEYFRITPDSARIWVKEVPTVKGAKGGFAVGGLINQAKTVTSRNLMLIAPDSARIWVNNTSKGAKGGFAVGGLINQGKGTSSQFFQLTPMNYFIGQDAGSSITTGVYNSFFGYQSGKKTSTGGVNVFIGYKAGTENTTGSQNLFIGYNSGMLNTTGQYNLFLGTSAGEQNTTGSSNLFIGNFAGTANTTGAGNLFIGHNCASSNVDGNDNLFIGGNSGMLNVSGSGNTFLGSSTGKNNTSGYGNTFVGEGSGYNNLNGNFNIAVGMSSAPFITNNCNNNIFLGYSTGRELVDNSSSNIFIGSASGVALTQGNSNIIIGKNGGQISNGNNNVFIGDYTGNIVAADNNVIIGSSAGGNINGGGNVMIGYAAGRYTECSNKLFISNNDHDSLNVLIYGEFDKKSLTFNANVGIGTTQPDKKFHVVGDARITGDIYYGASPSVTKYTKADYVFKPEYNSYYEPFKVEEFIKTNGHLPWMTSAKDEINGVNLTRMQFETVETVENLQLQIIELKKEHQQEINAIKAELETIKALLKK